MQSDVQNGENNEDVKASEPVHTPTPVSVSSTSFKLPLENSEKMHKGLILGIAIGAAILVLLAIGVWGIAMALSKPKHEDTPLVTEQKTSSVPAGWKKFASKKFGVSFIAPEKWSVKEDDLRMLHDSQTGLNFGYSVTVTDPAYSDDSYPVTIIQGKLDVIVGAAVKYQEGLGLTTSQIAQKWHDHDAVELTVKEKDSASVATGRLFVQVGEFIVSMPDKTVTLPAMGDSSDTRQGDYVKFVDSIRIDAKAIAAEVNVKIEMPSGKDVTLGAVTVPTGWKKINSAKYGISFATPNEWVSDEKYDSLSYDAILNLTIKDAKDSENEVHIAVTKDALNDYMNGMVLMYKQRQDTTVKIEKMNWMGHDARRIIVQSNLPNFAMILVQIGTYTYTLPDSDASQSGLDKGKIDANTYRQVVETIRITPTS